MLDTTRDHLNVIAHALLYCWLAGFALLLIWLVVLFALRGTIHKLHAPMFGLTNHELDVVFYCGMGLLKLLVIVFFFLPWLALRLVLAGW